MTEDHLFPKGLVKPGQRRVTKFLQKIEPNFRGQRTTFLAQNGVVKATLCADCNNRVLGAELDPSLIEIYKTASAVLEKGRLPIVEPVSLTGVNLNKVTRAVAGHLIASDDQVRHRHRMVRRLRRFVLQEGAGLHQDLRFHMWLYPFSRQGMFSDFHHAEFGAPYNTFWISAFKTYPLAFAFSAEVENPNYRLRGIIDLTQAITSDTSALFTLRVDTKPIVDSNWPFAPHENGAILTGENGSLTTALYQNKRSQK